MNKDKVYLEGYVVGRAADTLGYQGLMVQLENLDIVEIDKNLVHKEIGEPQLLKLKDVIARIKGFDIGTQKVWLNEILNELGSDYGTLKYKAGYEQGKVEGALIHCEEPQKPVVPQFVANWIEYCKLTGVSLYHALEMGDLYFYNYANQKDDLKLKDFFETENNQEAFARAWLDGYTVEKEKRYLVKMKGIEGHNSYLKYNKNLKHWYFGSLFIYNNDVDTRTYHTRKELEEAGFGWVFDCEGMEIEKVE